MATSMRGMKLSKQERRLLKKENKAKHTVLKHDNILTCFHKTKHLVVSNGGLGNGIQREELFNVFHEFGNVVDIVMMPKKPYAFVSFEQAEQAERAHTAVHGKKLLCPEELAVPDVRFYLSYVDHVPIEEFHSSQLPPGLVLMESFISEEYERQLVECLDWEDVENGSAEGTGKTLKHRKVKHYGYEFLYGINNVEKDKPLQQGIPEQCTAVIDKLLSQDYISERPDQLTVNQYQPGQGIPPHIDTHSAFGDWIIILSLGSQAVMEFRHPDGREVPVILPRRSLAIMAGESRYVWTHGLTPRKLDIVPTATGNDAEPKQVRFTLAKRDTRTSFTFRRIRRGPCNCVYPAYCDSQKLQGQSKEQEKKKDITAEEELKAEANNKECTPSVSKLECDAASLEASHVHQVYEEIAGHFSDTRHTPWPHVVEFLKQQPDGALVADVGCGNGKYLNANNKAFMIGSDRSSNLCEISRSRGFEVFTADVLSIPVRSNFFDVVICIAVIHHLSTTERRLWAMQELIRILRPGGEALVYVWALEQEKNKVKSNYLSEHKIETKRSHMKPDGHLSLEGKVGVFDSARGQTDSKTAQELQESTSTAVKSQANKIKDCESSMGVSLIPEMGTEEELNGVSKSGTRNIAAKDMLSQLSLEDNNCSEAAIESSRCITHGKSACVCTASYSDSSTDPMPESHTLHVHTNRTHFDAQDLLVPWHRRQKLDGKEKSKEQQQSQIFHRYYHVFKDGELEEICRQIPGVIIVRSYYDKGNWCVVLQKLK